jgi:AcrR family transcriptional regulator
MVCVFLVLEATMGKIRARKEEEKERRIEEIFLALERLLDRHSLREISLSRLAAEAGIAKSTVYVYWRTREEMFFLYYERVFNGVISRIEERIRGCRVSVEEFADIYCEEITSRPNFLRLVDYIYPVIEQHRAPEVVAQVMERLMMRFDAIHNVISASLGITPVQAERFAMYAFVMALGWYQVTSVDTARGGPSMKVNREADLTDFRSALHSSMTTFARGMGIV